MVEKEEVEKIVHRARKFCLYDRNTDTTYGPWMVTDLTGCRDSVKSNKCRQWNTAIATALVEKAFKVNLKNYPIVDQGPWEDTVSSLTSAINNEIPRKALYPPDEIPYRYNWSWDKGVVRA